MLNENIFSKDVLLKNEIKIERNSSKTEIAHA